VKKLVLALSAIGLAALVGPASGGTLYTNGPLNGTGGSVGVNNGYADSDSFTVSGSSTVTSFDFALWNYSFDITTNIDWSIGTSIGGSQDGSGVGVPITGVFDNPADGGSIDVYTYTVSGLDVSLPGAGTYYLTLTNALAQFYGTTADGDGVFWDENDGPSEAYQDFDGGSYYTLANNDIEAGGVCANGQVDCTGSETFDINGTASAPEPASSILVGSGMLLAAILRRKAGRRKIALGR
jgi:hypothetical protein